MRKELFDTETLSKLDKMDLETAKSVSLELVKQMPKKTINQATAVNRVTHDIQKAFSPTEVSRIMYQIYLSGTGFGTIGSAWKKHYGNV